LRTVFFGTPAFAVPCLDALHDISEIVGVVCQPDRPQGRGLTLTPPPVKQYALQLRLPVVQPTKLKTGEFAAWLRAQAVDVALVVAYGRILPSDVLMAPRLGCVNVHASLLPKYRGAAPITWAIVRGEKTTGVTLMEMDPGMDTGPMLEQSELAIGDDETTGELAERLSILGAALVKSGLPKFVAGDYLPIVQDHAGATLAPMLMKENGRVPWAESARAVHDHVRGMSPWPGAFTTLGGKTIKVHHTRIAEVSRVGEAPGTVLIADKTRVLVACQEGAIDLLVVQLEGKKPVSGTAWHTGRGVKEGDRLGT
jgi:methionyl-tRNA formyltransferase